MFSIIKFIADMFNTLYATFDVKLFDDFPLSISQFFVGLICFTAFINFIKYIVSISSMNTSLNDFRDYLGVYKFGKSNKKR